MSKLHICKYCGCETKQPDEDCYKNPKNNSIIDNFNLIIKNKEGIKKLETENKELKKHNDFNLKYSFLNINESLINKNQVIFYETYSSGLIKTIFYVLLPKLFLKYCDKKHKKYLKYYNRKNYGLTQEVELNKYIASLPPKSPLQTFREM